MSNDGWTIECPQCGGNSVSISAMVYVRPEVDSAGDIQTTVDTVTHDWDDDSDAICNECGHSSIAGDFLGNPAYPREVPSSLIEPAPLTFDDYADQALAMAIYPGRDTSPLYPLLGLPSEVGELAQSAVRANIVYSTAVDSALNAVAEVGAVCGILKKAYRDHHGVVPEEQKSLLRASLDGAIAHLTDLRSMTASVSKIAVRQITSSAAKFDQSQTWWHELGDCIWYIAALAREFKFGLGAVASANVKKLLGRKARGTLQGSGDDR
jgi:hypothetical protein